MFSMVLLCPPFFSLLPLFFDGKLSGSKYGSVGALYAEKEQQCLATGVACRYTTHIVVLFLISETSLHDGGAQCANNSSGGANVDVFILWLWTFADKTGGYAVFRCSTPRISPGWVHRGFFVKLQNIYDIEKQSVAY